MLTVCEAGTQFDCLRRGVDEQAADVARRGRALGFPFVSAQHDFSDPEPMAGADGRPYAQSLFDWFASFGSYWEDRRVGLVNPLMRAVRTTAEPFYYDGASLMDWRHRPIATSRDLSSLAAVGMKAAIVTPTRLPLGVVGAVFWASDQRVPAIADLFDDHVASLAYAALRLCGAYAELHGTRGRFDANLSAREVQCLRWTAYGKTDHEIGIILGITTTTVRFHLKNSGLKLASHGRSQAACRAMALGYVSAPH